VLFLGEVAIIFRVMPDGPEVDLENIKKNIADKIPKNAKLNKIEDKPVAFGLKALEVQIILDDRQGGTDEIEEILNNIEFVQSVETIHVGLL
jgi:elongation factor 1-beta